MIDHVHGFGVDNGVNDDAEKDAGSEECKVFDDGKLFFNWWELADGVEISIITGFLFYKKMIRVSVVFCESHHENMCAG